MKHAFSKALAYLEPSFRRLETRVPPPSYKQTDQGGCMRYDERTIEQALILKLARQITGLIALQLLVDHGLPQEQGVMQRVLDEIGEDIQFLAHPILGAEQSPAHERYLEDFWAEEFDHPDPLKATQKRRPVRREKVLAYNARVLTGENPELRKALSTTLHKTYSGFVHAASSHVMDLCEVDPPLFSLRVQDGDSRKLSHYNDAWNYFYRGLMSLSLVAMALGDWELVEESRLFLVQFEMG